MTRGGNTPTTYLRTPSLFSMIVCRLLRAEAPLEFVATAEETEPQSEWHCTPDRGKAATREEESRLPAIMKSEAPRPTRHLVPYIHPSEPRIVLERVPAEARARLRDVFVKYKSTGVRTLGWVRTRGRRDINLVGLLPPRVSLRLFVRQGSSPSEFGAPLRGQWPPWSVRRFLLYDVLLHELGHLQVVHEKSRDWNRRYASETRAQEFADEMRRRLFAEPFDHPDPIHNAPSVGEKASLLLWNRLDKDDRYRLALEVIRAPHEEMPDIGYLGDVDGVQEPFLRQVLCGVVPSNE